MPQDRIEQMYEEIGEMLKLSEAERQKKYGTDGWKLLVKEFTVSALIRIQQAERSTK